jgi:hypothetical protein
MGATLDTQMSGTSIAFTGEISGTSTLTMHKRRRLTRVETRLSLVHDGLMRSARGLAILIIQKVFWCGALLRCLLGGVRSSRLGAHDGTIKHVQSLIVTFYVVVLIAWMCSCCGQWVKMVDWCIRSIR